MRDRNVRLIAIGVLLLPVLFGCQNANRPLQDTKISTTVPPGIQIPTSVQRLAILYPKSADHELMSAYIQLEGATFKLKTKRPSLKIVDRSDRDTILNEQVLQSSGAINDATATHVGQILGADSVLLFQINVPNLRGRTMSRMTGELPPVVLSSKIIAVETGEILYHNVVTVPIEKVDQEATFFSINPNLQTALTRGEVRTVEDLEEAFR